MPNTFDDVKKVLQSTANKVFKKTGEMYDYTKLSLSVSGIKNDIDELYKQIGKAIYTHYTDDDFSIDDISSLCEAVTLKKDELEAASEKLAELKNATICKECGASVNNESTFCAKCGAKL